MGLSIGIAIGEWLVAYYATRKLDQIFAKKEDFITELSGVINLSIEEYASQYQESDKNGRYSFYKSQKLIDELLKFRIMSGQGYNIEDLKAILTTEQNIIPPTIEQIKMFYAIFMQNIQASKKLRKLEIKESFEEEIFNLSQILRSIYDHIENLVSTYNGDLQVQWRNRLNAYIETIKEFKPKTALGLLHKFEASFDGTKNKPDRELNALIKYQEAVCLSLLGDEKSNISFVDAYKKDGGSIKYKEKAAFAYYKIKDFDRTKVLMEELLKEDEYNSTAWALKVFLSSEADNIINQAPPYVKTDTRFQYLLFNYYMLLNDLEKIYQLQNEGIIITGKNISPIEINIDSFNMGMFFVNIMFGEYLKEYSYVNFLENQFFVNELLTKLKVQLHNIAEKINHSEIKDKYLKVFFCEALVDFVLTKDKSHLLMMKDYVIRDKFQDINLIIICANLLQLEGYYKEAIEILNNSPAKSFESGYLKSFIFLRNNDKEAYFTAMQETYASTLVIDQRIVFAYFNSIFSLKEFGIIDRFDTAIFFDNKSFYSKEIQKLCEITAKTLITASIKDYEQELSKLSNHFSDDKYIMLFIADLYYYGKDFPYALEIYNKYLDKDQKSIHLFHYINCLYNLNIETAQALSLLIYWRENFTFNPYLTRVEYNLSVSMLDWQRCLCIVNYGLKNDPSFEDFAEFRLLVLDKLNDKNINAAIDDYLTVKNKNIRYISRIVDIFVKHGRSEEALILLAEYYSNDNLAIQMSYINAALAYSQEHEGRPTNIMKEYDVAELGHFVKYDLNGNVKFIELKEDTSQEMMVSNLIGKHKNDTVLLKRQMTKKVDEIKILRIMDKYLYLHDIILDKATDPHSGLPMEVISFNTSDDKNIIDVLKELFGEEGDALQQHVNSIMEQYYSGKISYSEVILNACAKDYIGGYYHLIFEQKGILTIPKIVYDNQDVCHNKPYIIDLSTLHMLFRLSDSYKVQYPNKFVISKHLVELIRNKLKELNANPYSSMSIVTTSTQVTRIDNTEEQQLSNIEYLKNLLIWIKNNCEEKVSFRTAEFSIQLAKEGTDEDFNSYGQFVKDYILNTMLLREDLDAILITDDTIYNKMLNLPLAKTMSAEVYVKSILPIDCTALREFLNLKYLGFDCPSFVLIDEFEKKKRNEPNQYTFLVDNFTASSWRSFLDLIFHITSSCTEEEMEELKIIEKAFMQYCTNNKIIQNFREMIYFTAVQKQFHTKQIQFILNQFLNFSVIE